MSNQEPRRSSSVVLLFPLLMILLATPSPGAALDSQPQLSLIERLELIELLERTHAETLRLVQDVDSTTWTKRPAADRWSIGEIVEHLLLAEGAIRSRVAEMAEGASRQSASKQSASNVEAIENKEVLSLDQLVKLGSDRSRRFEAPEPIRPTGGLEHDAALRQLLEGRAESIRFVLETELPLRSYTSMAPIGTELDGHGWLALLAAHNLRHNKQIIETRNQLGLTTN